jgi:hypothetical protein
MIIGVILIIFGALFLLQNLGYIAYDFWNVFWPLVLIAIGVKIAMKRGEHHHHGCCGKGEDGKKEGESQKI